MTEEDRARFEDLIVKAVQSGKKETSDLVTEIMSRIEPTIELAIGKYVNGKIDRMNTKFDTYMKEDNEWKESVTPSIEIMKSIQGFSKTTSFLVKVVVATGACITAIYGSYNLLK